MKLRAFLSVQSLLASNHVIACQSMGSCCHIANHICHGKMPWVIWAMVYAAMRIHTNNRFFKVP